MSLKFHVIGPPSLLIGLFAGPARRGMAFFAAAFFGAAFFAGFLLFAVFFASFLRATFIPLSMPDIAASFSAFERRRRDGMSQIDRKRSGDCRPTSAGCKLAPRPFDRGS